MSPASGMTVIVRPGGVISEYVGVHPAGRGAMVNTELADLASSDQTSNDGPRDTRSHR
jgi:hypothetical protein